MLAVDTADATTKWCFYWWWPMIFSPTLLLSVMLWQSHQLMMATVTTVVRSSRKQQAERERRRRRRRRRRLHLGLHIMIISSCSCRSSCSYRRRWWWWWWWFHLYRHTSSSSGLSFLLSRDERSSRSIMLVVMCDVALDLIDCLTVRIMDGSSTRLSRRLLPCVCVRLIRSWSSKNHFTWSDESNRGQTETTSYK